jgi:hypothetical protein
MCLLELVSFGYKRSHRVNQSDDVTTEQRPQVIAETRCESTHRGQVAFPDDGFLAGHADTSPR